VGAPTKQTREEAGTFVGQATSSRIASWSANPREATAARPGARSGSAAWSPESPFRSS